MLGFRFTWDLIVSLVQAKIEQKLKGRIRVSRTV